MKILLTYVAWLKLSNPPSGSILEIEEGNSVSDVLLSCGLKEEHHRFIVPVVNGSVRGLNESLSDGDSLHLLMPIGGG